MSNEDDMGSVDLTDQDGINILKEKNVQVI